LNDSPSLLLDSAFGPVHLERYPAYAGETLRAWDAADAYLLEYFCELSLPIQPVLIVHDQFGALSCALADWDTRIYGDSWVARESMQRNLAANRASVPTCFMSELSLEAIGQPLPRIVIGRVPKAKSQLRYILTQLSALLEEGALLLLAGMEKHLSKGQMALVSEYFGDVEYIPGKKKARIWRARNAKKATAVCDDDALVEVPHFSLSLENGPNVFSRGQLDIGTRFFLSHFERLPVVDKVIDLACGCGVLGLAYKRQVSHAQILFCDESYQAIASARANAQRHFKGDGMVFEVGDGLKAVESGSYDLVLCNPPFHQQHTVSKVVALEMFRDALRVLRARGECWIIANRHLGYHQALKRIFGHYDLIASNSKFVILRAVKK